MVPDALEGRGPCGSFPHTWPDLRTRPLHISWLVASACAGTLTTPSRVVLSDPAPTGRLRGVNVTRAAQTR
jgi:hypothetical protein